MPAAGAPLSGPVLTQQPDRIVETGRISKSLGQPQKQRHPNSRYNRRLDIILKSKLR